VAATASRILRFATVAILAAIALKVWHQRAPAGSRSSAVFGVVDAFLAWIAVSGPCVHGRGRVVSSRICLPPGYERAAWTGEYLFWCDRSSSIATWISPTRTPALVSVERRIYPSAALLWRRS
jgi:hypothetical protein